MPRRKVRIASSISAPENSDDESERKTDDEMSLVPSVTRIATAKVNPSLYYNHSLDDSSMTMPPAGAEKRTTFLVTNWLVGEGEG
jgi:hypothetical protein